MESERFENTEKVRRANEKVEVTWVANATPLALAPYSGVEAHIGAFTKAPIPHDMMIRVEIEDLFGKRYRMEVLANDKKE